MAMGINVTKIFLITFMIGTFLPLAVHTTPRLFQFSRVLASK